MNQYMYDGPVMEFDTCVANRWQGLHTRRLKRKPGVIWCISLRRNKPYSKYEDNPPRKSGNG